MTTAADTHAIQHVDVVAVRSTRLSNRFDNRLYRVNGVCWNAARRIIIRSEGVKTVFSETETFAENRCLRDETRH